MAASTKRISTGCSTLTESRVALVTVSGASNVTGFVQPIHRLARKAHAVGSRILIDASQLAAHRRIDVKPDTDPEHLDFVALSAHKMYAPFGTGALIGSRDVFLQGAPEYQGGGTVAIVTDDEVHWAGVPDREEAGSPNVVGAVAMAVAARTLTTAGMEGIERHESALTTCALDRLRSVPDICFYGETDPRRTDDRIGVVSFNLGGFHHALVAAILAYEGGIGVRNGCFCAQPYVMRLLGLGAADQTRWRRAQLAGDNTGRPGMVRVSFAAYNTSEDIEVLVEMLHRIMRHDYKGAYEQAPESGDYRPVGYEDTMPAAFF